MADEPPPEVPGYPPPEPRREIIPGYVYPPGTAGPPQMPPTTPPPRRQGWGYSDRPPLRPLSGLATATVTLLTIMAIAGVISVFIEVAYAAAIDDFVREPFSSASDRVISLEDRRSSFTILSIIGIVVTGIVLVVWQQRARANANALGAGGQRHTRALAAASWFIPIANLWLPKQVINDLWRASDPVEPNAYRVEGRPVAALVNAWWALWIIGGLVTRGIANSVNAAIERGDLDSAASMLRFGAFLELSSVAAAVLALMIVRQITARLERRAALFDLTLG